MNITVVSSFLQGIQVKIYRLMKEGGNKIIKNDIRTNENQN